MNKLRYKVQGSDVGKRLDLFVHEKLTEKEITVSRSQIKNWIENGQVLVQNSKPKKSGLPLEAGFEIEIEIPNIKKIDLSPIDVAIEILYEDDSFAVLYKPAGISMHPSTTENAPTVVHGLLYKLKTLSSVGGVERPGIVHRIDKGTSGVVVVSKTDQAHENLAQQFKAHTVERKYVTLVCGDLTRIGQEGRIETFYDRNPKDRKKMTGKVTSGRKAITNWKVLKVFQVTKNTKMSLVECRLETGRTHQIRVHMSEAGFSILGDKTYGDWKKVLKELKMQRQTELAEMLEGLSYQLLHAESLGFLHPETGVKMFFEYKKPDAFAMVLKKIESILL